MSVYKIWYGYRDGFPKKSRYTLGDKIDNNFLQILQLLQKASYQKSSDKLPTLESALVAIDTLKFLLKISWELRVLDNKKYEALSLQIDETGRQVGGWRRGIQTKTSA